MSQLVNPLSNRLRRQLLRHGGRAILVAVSGGPDSTALLHLLHELSGELGLRLEVAHLQHGIRGAAAQADARFVAGLAARLGRHFHLKEIDLPGLRGRAGRGNLEQMARQERYQFFAEIARARQLDCIATAHTQDDQAETMLMWLLRGAGRKGLAGMSDALALASRTGSALQVIRPLLDTSKGEILAYLRERRLDYRTDATNSDTALLRNWLRLELLPLLRERIDDRVGARLAAQAGLLRDEQALLDELAGAELERCRRADGLDRLQFVRHPPALQRLLLRRWIETSRGSLRGIDLDHVEALRGLAESGPPQGRLAIPGGWEFRRQYDLLSLTRSTRKARPICYFYPVVLEQSLIVVEAGVAFHFERQPAPPRPEPENSLEALFDGDQMPGNLTVRNFRNGDRFEPLGMSGHKKVKDLFIDHKLALSERARLPILVAGDRVLWIPGHGRSRVALVTPASQAVMRIKVVPLGT